MSLKSSNKVEENVWEVEVSVDGDAFESAVNKAYLQNRKKNKRSRLQKG